MDNEKKVRLEVILTLVAGEVTDDMLDNLVQEMDYSFYSHTDGIAIINTEIREYESIIPE